QGAPAEEGGAADPRGSDLWLEELDGTGSATLEWTDEPGRWSVLAAAPGSTAALTVTMTWPQEVTTPFLVPGIVLGAVLLLAGAAWFARIGLAARADRARRASAGRDAEGTEGTEGTSSAETPSAPATPGS